MLGLVRVVLEKDIAEGIIPLDHALATAKAHGIGRYSSKYPRVKVILTRDARKKELRRGLEMALPRSIAEKFVERGLARYLAPTEGESDVGNQE